MEEQVRILCVDDEKNVLRALERLFMEDACEVLTASSAEEGLEILRSASLGQIVISDYRMPEMNGVDFLKEVCRHWPDTIRIVLSGYADTASIVGAINEGQIYKFIPKPWNNDELKVTIANAIDRYNLHKRNMQLTRELQDTNKELQALNENLEKLVEKRTSELMLQNTILMRSQNIVDALPCAVLGIDLNGLIVFCNKCWDDLFPENQKVVGMDRYDSLPEDINTFIETVIRENGCSAQVRVHDRIFYANGTLMRHPDGQEGVVITIDREECVD